MKLLIFSRQRPLFSGKVRSLTLPGSVAPFQILPQHMNFISTLEKGVVTYHPDGGAAVTMSIEKGIVKVQDDVVTLLVEGDALP